MPRRRMFSAQQIAQLSDVELVPTTSAAIRALQQERAQQEPPPPPPPLEDEGPPGPHLAADPEPAPESDQAGAAAAPSEPPADPDLDPEAGAAADEASEPPRRPRGRPKGSGKKAGLTLDQIAARHQLPSIEEVAHSTQMFSTGTGAVPSPEDNAYLSHGVTSIGVGMVEDQAGTTAPNNLADLMAICPTIGDGQYWIEVVRRAPQQYGGVACKGTQRPIRQHMTDRDFVEFYGGGDYSLTLYGPPPRGGTIDPRTGRPLHKALTKPVKLEISPAVYPPNLQSAVLHDEEQIEGPEMRTYTSPTFSSGWRPNTTADARALEVSLEHERKMREADEKRERELREDAARGNTAVGPLIDVVRKASEDAVRVVERQSAEARRLAEERAAKAEVEARRERERAEVAVRAAEARAERAQNRPTEAHELVGSMATLIQAVRPPDDGGAARALDQARQEVARATEKHAAEVTRLIDKHTQEIQRLAADYRAETDRRTEQYRGETERLDRQHREEMKRQEERLKEAVDRAERRAEEAERKAEQRIADSEQRADRRLQELRDEHRRLLDEARAAAQTRLDDERRQADRDKQSQEATFQTRLAGQKDMYENRMSSLQQEITRLQAEVDRWRKEADDNKDLSKHLERAQEAAAALGWAPQTGSGEDDTPKDWKSMFGRIAMEIVQKAPEIVQSAGDTVARLRAQSSPPPEQVQAMQHAAMLAQAQQTLPRQMAGAPPGSLPLPPPLRGRDGQPFHAAPVLRFGTEDSGLEGPLPRPIPDPYQPQSAPPPQAPAAPPSPAQVAPYVPPVSHMVAPEAPLPVEIPTGTYAPGGGTYAPQVAAYSPGGPAPLPAPAPAAPPPAAAPAGLVVGPDLVLQYAAPLEVACESGESPDRVATEIIGLLGADTVRMVLTSMTPARIAVELQKAGRGSSPLVRRAGQQFLRDLWTAAGKQVGVAS